MTIAPIDILIFYSLIFCYFYKMFIYTFNSYRHSVLVFICISAVNPMYLGSLHLPGTRSFIILFTGKSECTNTLPGKISSSYFSNTLDYTTYRYILSLLFLMGLIANVYNPGILKCCLECYAVS